MKTIMYVRSTGIYSCSRATKEITTLLKAGYRILAVGWDREGNSEKKCLEVFQEYAGQIKFNMFGSQIRNHVGFKNVDKLYKWLRFVEKVLEDNYKEIDVVHACNLDTILFCYKKCKKHGIKVVYDIFDYYVDNHTLVPKVVKPIIEAIEISVINHADLTIICTEERREQIKGSIPKKLIVIHNTPEVELLKNDIIYDYFYCGTLAIQRLIEETFTEYKNNTDLKIGFAGYGLLKDHAESVAKEYENFTYLGQVMYKDCLENESRSICLSAIYDPRNNRNHRLCAPNKFYESLALGKPIIVCSGTGIDKIVKENDIGIVIDYDVKQFYNAIRYLKANPSKCKKMGERARKLYEEKYNWGIMSSILLNAYKEIL